MENQVLVFQTCFAVISFISKRNFEKVMLIKSRHVVWRLCDEPAY
jgi:hypothetical protein